MIAVRRHAACETGIAADSAHVTTAADVARVAVRIQNGVNVSYAKLSVFRRVGMKPADVSLKVGRGWAGGG